MNNIEEYLLLVADGLTDRGDDPQRREQAHGEYCRPAHRILIVDDNVDSARALAELLELSGFETRTSYDGQAAVTLTRAYKPDAVLMDLVLPKLNGFEVAGQIRKDAELQTVRLIALTGYGGDEVRTRCLQVGFEEQFVKPIDYRKLIDLLNSTC